MNKSLLIIAAGFLSLSATAQQITEGPVLDQFPGQASYYNMSGRVEGYQDEGIPVQALLENDVVYLSNIVPGMFEETVVITATREGNTLTIPTQKIYAGYNIFDMFTADITIGKMNSQGLPANDGYQMVINADGTITDPNNQIIAVYGDLSDYGMSEYELLTYVQGVQLAPYQPSEQTFLPEGAVTREYTFEYKGKWGYNYSEVGQVYVDGATVYLDGLTGGTGIWVKGTLADGKLTIPSGQFMGPNLTYLYNFQALNNLQLDKEGFVKSYDLLPELTLLVTDNGFVAEEGQVAGLVCDINEYLGPYMQDLVITKNFDDDDVVTSISQVEAATSAIQYDLQGRRAGFDAKGLVIRNGKLNFVK